jgi:hypothetical protein
MIGAISMTEKNVALGGGERILRGTDRSSKRGDLARGKRGCGDPMAHETAPRSSDGAAYKGLHRFGNYARFRIRVEKMAILF